jgi:cytoskeletal protein RodZ
MALGEKLREERLRRRLTTSEVAAATRMKVQTVEAIEREDFSKMPAPIYCKGFIKLYAEMLGIDPEKLISEYVANFVEPKHSLLPRADDTSLPVETTPHPDAVGKQMEPSSGAQDLFSYHGEKKEDSPEIKAQVKTHAETSIPAAGATQTGASLIEQCITMFSSLKNNFFPPKPQAVPAPAVSSEPSSIPGNDAQPGPETNGMMKTVSVIFGLVVIGVFLMSIMSRCSKPHENAPPVPPKATKELKIVVPPPPTYAD